MAPALKPSRDRESEETEFQSSSLWVGSLTTDTTESDLAQLFRRYGEIDRITAYSSRSFAFIYFRRVDDAVAARQALQGATLNGNRIKIEFSRPAKPCKSLWVGGISPSVTKEHLQAEFGKFGKIEDFRFLRERNTAFVDYFELDAAVQAAKSMNGRRIGGGQIRVDFLRSNATKKEQWPNAYDAKDGPFPGRGMGPTDDHLIANQQLSTLGDRRGENQPSNVLWVGYPPSVQIDEQMLHNAMILFGEIEKIKSYPTRNYSFVEFRSVEEARRAKEGLQGRLFGDPRITIMYSNSELAPGNDDPGFYSGIKRSRPEMFLNDPPFRSSTVDTCGRGNPMPPSGGILGPMRPFRGSLEPTHNNGPDYNDFVGHEANWRRPSPPGRGLLPSPLQGMRLPMRPDHGSWDAYDPSQADREIKRSRRDGSLEGFPPATIDDRLDRSYGLGGPVGGRGGRGFLRSDYIWRGIIAKGGTPVCHARCVPFGKDIETELPDVINCSARTGLDMLAKHYAEAIGFEIFFFLPDSEDDFASYTEFLHYLGSKNRAGVAKFDDGTTLFLVPPSDFLTNVLKVSGPERLYGVVLKLPPPPTPPAVPGGPSYRQETQPPPSSYMDQRRASPANPSHSYAAREERASSLDYKMGPREDLKSSSKPLFTPTSEPVGVESGPKEQTRAGVSLTPELIATLASLLPVTSQSGAPEAHQPPSGTTISPLPQSVVPSNRETQLQAWNQDHHPTLFEPAGHLYQQYGNQYIPQGQFPPQNYPPISSTTNYSGSMVHGVMQFQEQPMSLPQQPLPPLPLNNYPMFSQGSNLAVSLPVPQQYQPEAPPVNQNYGTDLSGLHGYPSFQHANNQGLASNQPYIANNPSLPQNIMPLSADKGNIELPAQAQQLQSNLSGTGQGSSEGGEGDKNQRYQSTLQFAASLLLQIQQQQQQQQTNNQAGQGTGNQL